MSTKQTISTNVPKRPPAPFYVELAGEDAETGEHLLFRGVLVHEAHGPNEAVRIAIEESPTQVPVPMTGTTRDVRPVRWEEFLSRRLNPERARKVEAAIRNKTWEGWPMGGRS